MIGELELDLVGADEAAARAHQWEDLWLRAADSLVWQSAELLLSLPPPRRRPRAFDRWGARARNALARLYRRRSRALAIRFARRALAARQRAVLAAQRCPHCGRAGFWEH